MTIELIVVNAMHQVKVVNLVKGESLSVALGDTIRLTHKADIKTFRKGSDLVIKNASGEEFVLKDFYLKPEGADEGQLFSWDDTEGQEKEILSTEYSEPINTVAAVADTANAQTSNEVVNTPAETAAAKEEDDDDDAAALLLANSSEPGMGMLAGIALVGAALLSTSSGRHGGDSSGGTVQPVRPAAPTSYDDNVGTIQNPASTATVTDDATPGVNIGAGLTDVPSLYVDGIKVPATYNPTTGTLTPETPLSEGLHALTYTLTPAGGAGRSEQ